MTEILVNTAVRDRSRRSALRLRLAPTYEQHQERAVGEASSVLDVGCGANSPIGRFTRRFSHALGVDCFGGAIALSRSRGIHDEYLTVDVLRLADHVESASFDAVVAFDLIEHLERDDGLALLAGMERIARTRVVVFTPNGFLPQEPTDGNPFQAHRSGWAASDFRRLGYEVHGVNGLRQLRGCRGSLRWRPGRFWGLVSDLTQPLVYRHPRLAFHLLCTKDIG